MKMLRWFDEGDGGGDGTATVEAPGTDEVIEITPEIVQKSAAANAFGLTEDPFKDAEPAGPTPEGDKPTEPTKEPTSDDGSEKLLAGKYKTSSDLEKGYTSLVDHKTTLETENKTMRDQLDQLTAKLAQPEKPESKPAGPTPEETEAQAKITDALDLLKETLGDDAVDALKAIIPKTAGNELPEEVQTRLDQLDTLLEKDQKNEAKLNMDALKERFPDSARPEMYEKMVELGKKMQENPDDQALGLDLVYKAAAFDEIPQLVEKLVVERLKTMSAKDKELALQNGLGTGEQPGGGGSRVERTVMRQAQKDAFGV